MAPISAASGFMAHGHLGCTPADSVVAADIGICLAASLGWAWAMKGPVWVCQGQGCALKRQLAYSQGRNAWCTRTERLLCGCWGQAGVGRRWVRCLPIWVVQLAPLTQSPYGCFFILLRCKFSWNMSIPWGTVKFQFPLQNLLRSSPQQRWE